MDPENFIPFIRATNIPTANTVSSACEEKTETNFKEDGLNTRNFYEDIVGLSSTEISEKRSPKVVERKPILKHRRKAKGNSRKDFSEREQNNYLQSAQTGDKDSVFRWIRKGMAIDTQDKFGWTALMCAIHEGHVGVVKLLLENGADSTVVDAKKMNVMDLAKASKNKKMLSLISAHTSGIDINAQEEDHKLESFYCAVCQEQFQNTTKTKHETSTLHLFNCQYRPVSSSYLLPESNKGFQMMLRSGWNAEEGLGPSGEGQKHPVKTVLKRDRKGLGLVEQIHKKAKVTHFNPRDSKAVESTKRIENRRTLGKRAQSKILRKEKRKERNFRLEFYGE